MSQCDLLSEELDPTYRAVAARLPDNKHVRFETIAGKQELVLSPPAFRSRGDCAPGAGRSAFPLQWRWV